MGPRRTSRNRRWLVVLVVVFVLIGLASRLRPETFAPLIEARFPGVEWIDAETLFRSMNAPELAAPIILDVRTEEEFAVSHLRGAVRVEPGHRDFESLAIDRGAMVVVYCSVGYRSAAIVDALRASGASDVRNLTGGIFAWANEGLPLFKRGEPATTVHPYHPLWGTLLQDELRHPHSRQLDEQTATTRHEEEHSVHWSYEPGTGPADWGAMDPAWRLCAEGRSQSPIDLANAKTAELPRVEIHLPSGREVEVLNQEGVIDALDNGHTIQVNAKTGEKMTVGDKSYALLQFHLHAPSEHTVDGEHFPMEMHFVHQAADGALAVIGVLIEEGAENRALAPLWKQLAEAPGTETTVELPVRFGDRIFTTGENTGVYAYEGSLTTPPCTERVRWFLRKTPAQLSKAQIAAFTAVHKHNNRPVQALHDRVCYVDETPDVTIK